MTRSIQKVLCVLPFLGLGACDDFLKDAGEMYDELSTDHEDDRSMVSGITSYQEYPVSGVRVGLLDAEPDGSWGTDALMTVMDESMSASDGYYELTVGDSSDYWLLGTYEAEDHQFASFQSLHLNAIGDHFFAFVYLDTIDDYANLCPSDDASSDSADTASPTCACQFTWQQLSYICRSSEAGESCTWVWGSC